MKKLREQLGNQRLSIAEMRRLNGGSSSCGYTTGGTNDKGTVKHCGYTQAQAQTLATISRGEWCCNCC